MAKLYDHRLGAGVLVADERVDELIQTGNYSFLKGPRVHLVDEYGELYNVPPENAKAAIEAGYFYAPANVVQEGKLKKEIEETPEKSLGYGLLRGMTFGVSDAFGPKRELQLRREMDPGLTTTGEIISLFTPGGLTGLAARGASKVASKLISGGVKASQTADKAKRTGSVLNRRVITSQAAGGAAEGLVVGSMYGTSSFMLDDPENYPGIADHIYAGAGFGLVAGGVVGSISKALSGAGGVFKKMRDKAYLKVLDPKQAQIKKVAGKDYANMDRLEEIGRIMSKLDAKDPKTGQRIMQNLDDPKALVKEIGEKWEEGSLLHTWGTRLGQLKETVESAIKKSGQSVDALQVNIDKMATKLEEEILLPLRQRVGSSTKPEYKRQIRSVEREIEDFKRFALEKTGGKNTAKFTQAEEIKTEWNFRAYQDPSTPEANKLFMRQIAGILKNRNEEFLEALGGRLSQIDETLLPSSTYADFIEAKEIYSTLNTIQYWASVARAREISNARIPLTSWITGGSLGGGFGGGIMAGGDILTGGLVGAGTFAATGLLRKFAKDSGDLILARTMNRITDYGEMLNSADVSKAAIHNFVELLVRGGSAATVKIKNPFPDNDKKTITRFKQLKKDIEQLKTNPQTLYVRMNEMLPDVQGDQTINQELAQTMANVVGFLSEKMPTNTSTSQLLYNNDQTPPMNQILKFMRYVDILDSPNKILQYVAGGKLMPEHMEAITTIFPRLYQAQMEAVLNGLTDQGLPVKLDMAQKQSISRFLNFPASGIFSPSFISNQQKYFQGARDQQSQQKGMSVKFPELGTAVSRGQEIGVPVNAL